MLEPNPNAPVIAIDGPVGAGKGTVALQVAQHLGWHTLDSGALYRVVALAAQQQQIALDAASQLAELAAQLPVEFIPNADLNGLQVWLAGTDVSLSLRTEACGTAASQVAKLPAVRTGLLARQKAFQQLPGLVADGRDMGTVVFPDAGVKIFLTASAEIRAQRRHKQLKDKGIDASLSSLIEDIKSRDAQDCNRSVAPLVPAADALELDTTNMPITAVVDAVLTAALHQGVITQQQFTVSKD